MIHSTNPIIVVGMHRSGTSLVTRLLEELGVFFGWIQDENAEATFFLKRNEAILRACGGSWEHPDAVDSLLASSAMRKRVVRQLRSDLGSLGFISFLGPKRYVETLRHREALPAWGWKDPRNSLLLPLWLELFPAARIIHVVRNGVDVAISLCNQARRNLATDGASTAVHSPPDQANRTRRGCAGGLRLDRLVEWHEYLCKRFAPLGRYCAAGIPRTLDVHAGLSLWQDYVVRAEEAMRQVDGPTLTIRFEDLLESPDACIDLMAAFSSMRPSAVIHESCLRLMDPQRAFGFRRLDPGQPLLRHARQCEVFRRFYPEPASHYMPGVSQCGGAP
ncbi:MAG TPA: sulfotransferase [Opitutaceae bacterium]